MTDDQQGALNLAAFLVTAVQFSNQIRKGTFSPMNIKTNTERGFRRREWSGC